MLSIYFSFRRNSGIIVKSRTRRAGVMTQIVIRKMQPADRARVVEILECWNLAPMEHLPDPESTGLDTPGAAFVAEKDGKIVGCASYILHAGRRAETGSLAVDPAVRGFGIGEKLQRARLFELQGLSVASIMTETDRPEVIDWYVRKFGYKIAGKRRKKHAFSLEDVDHWTVLELDLTQWRPAPEAD
jgi:3-keto-5-aminohexanoate cleavage enzyme